MSIEGKPDVNFFVFDSLDFKKCFTERIMLVDSLHDRVFRVPQFEVSSEESLLEYETMFLTQGYEGLIIRKPDAPYKCGRSTINEGYLLKLKRFSDAEAKVVKMERLIHEDGTAEDTLGALVVAYTVDNVARILKIGTGFSTAERKEFWDNQDEYIGKLVKFKYFEHGTKDLPRHPVFLGFRDKEDL